MLSYYQTGNSILGCTGFKCTGCLVICWRKPNITCTISIEEANRKSGTNIADKDKRKQHNYGAAGSRKGKVKSYFKNIFVLKILLLNNFQLNCLT